MIKIGLGPPQRIAILGRKKENTKMWLCFDFSEFVLLWLSLWGPVLMKSSDSERKLHSNRQTLAQVMVPSPCELAQIKFWAKLRHLRLWTHSWLTVGKQVWFLMLSGAGRDPEICRALLSRPWTS